MQIQVNTDNHLEGGDAFARHVERVVMNALDRFSHQITRVEVYLGDENGDKGGPGDKRCTMEARLAGRQPTAVTNHADTVDEALDGAAAKLLRSIESTIGRLEDDRDRTG